MKLEEVLPKVREGAKLMRGEKEVAWPESYLWDTYSFQEEVKEIRELNIVKCDNRNFDAISDILKKLNEVVRAVNKLMREVRNK